MVHETINRATINQIIDEYIAKGERPTAKLLGTHFATPTSPKIGVYLADYIDENPWQWHKAQLPEAVVSYVEKLHNDISFLENLVNGNNLNYSDEAI